MPLEKDFESFTTEETLPPIAMFRHHENMATIVKAIKVMGPNVPPAQREVWEFVAESPYALITNAHTNQLLGLTPGLLMQDGCTDPEIRPKVCRELVELLTELWKRYNPKRPAPDFEKLCPLACDDDLMSIAIRHFLFWGGH